MEGPFVKNSERALFAAGIARWGLRFNISGHKDDELCSDLKGFTFQRATEDFVAGTKVLTAAGAERVIAVCSSTGAQAAILANCLYPNEVALHGIVSRASIVDCFQSVMASVPEAQLKVWRGQESFPFSVGGRLVTLGSDLLSDISSFDLAKILPRLSVPVSLLHGEEDKVARLAVLERVIALAPPGLVSLTKCPGIGHVFAQGAADDQQSWSLEKCRALAAVD
jgi:hypothetical protein